MPAVHAPLERTRPGAVAWQPRRCAFRRTLDDERAFRLWQTCGLSLQPLSAIRTCAVSARVLLQRESHDESIARAIDVGIISAANVGLKAGLRRGSFREDLYYRLDTIELTLLPLRERDDDTLLRSSRVKSTSRSGVDATLGKRA